MTTKVIEANNDRVTFDLGVGDYELQAYGGKYLTVTREFSITQDDIELGAKEIDLETMQMGTHTFNVTVNTAEAGEFTVTLKDGEGQDVETKQTVNKHVSFTVTAKDNDTESADGYVFTVSRAGFKTVSGDAEADVTEYRAGGSESVTINAGSNVVTLTVIVEADAAVSIKIED